MAKKSSKIESDARRLSSSEVEQLWLGEEDKRLAAYRNGETSAQPGEEVFEAILNRC